MTPLRIAELFAGIGGVTGGLLDAGGYESVALLDTDQLAAETFQGNFPDMADRYHVRPVESRLSAPALLDMAGGSIDGILGCPPCQGLSQAGLRDPEDERNRLVLEMRRLICGVQPMFFIMENVPGLLRSELYESFTDSLDRHYRICSEVVNAAEYGVPQLRRRAVVIGFHRDLAITPTIPAATHGGEGRVFDYVSGDYLSPADQRGRLALQLRPLKPRVGAPTVLPALPLVTLGEALDDLPASPAVGLPRRKASAPKPEAVTYAKEPKTHFQRQMRLGAPQLRNHLAWQHGDDMRARLAAVAPGDCPREQGRRARNTKYFSQAYGRLHRDGLARTVTTNFHNPGGGRFTHYAAPRTITLREALRLQGFPDSFIFDALNASDAERLVGNAFPRMLAEVIGRHVRTLLNPVVRTAV